MKYVLVLQWPASEIKDYDALVEIENVLIENLPENNDLDGHDAGTGEMNIFIHTNEPQKTLEAIKNLFKNKELWATARVAYRNIEGGEYTLLWPKDLKTFTVA